MKLGFIGTGNMASAIMGGIIRNGIVPAQEIIGADKFAPGREKVKEQFGIHVTDDNLEVASKADVIVLSIAPQLYEGVITEIRDVVKENQIIVTIAAGKTLGWMKELFGRPVKIVRTMPNTPAMVGAGMTGVCPNEHVSKEETDYILTLLKGFGEAELITENLFDAVVSTSGSSPAMIFMIIEAMADAGVSGGLSRAKAYKFASQAVLGSAKMALDTGKHPGELKDMVCTPAGVTIEGVRKLEECGIRTAVFESLKVFEEVSRSM